MTAEKFCQPRVRCSRVRPTRPTSCGGPGARCCSTSSTTSWRAPAWRPHTTTRGTCWAKRRPSRPASLNTATQSLAWNIVVPRVEGDQSARRLQSPCVARAARVVDMEYGILPDDHVLVDDEGRLVPFQRRPVGGRRAPSRPARSSSPTCRRSGTGCTVWCRQRCARRPWRTPRPAGARGCRRDDTGWRTSSSASSSTRRRGMLSEPVRQARRASRRSRGRRAVPDVLEDRSDTWSHNVLRYHERDRPVQGRLDDRDRQRPCQGRPADSQRVRAVDG